MNRRAFITGLGAAALPFAGRAQQAMLPFLDMEKEAEAQTAQA